MNPLSRPEEALALLELDSIARGIVTLDALTKRAYVSVLVAEAVSPGKFLILFAGEQGDVEEAFSAGRAAAGTSLLDSLHLPDAHPGLLPLVRGERFGLEADDALSVQEYATVATALLALDRALKAANVRGCKLHTARGIGGKAYFVLAGALADVLAAEQAAQAATAESQRVGLEIIARISPDVRIEHL